MVWSSQSSSTSRNRRDVCCANAMAARRAFEARKLASRIIPRPELETARAAFKYRYTVIRPAQMPRGPSKPNSQKILTMGFAAAAGLALLTALASDLRSGKVFERWQIEREVIRHVLGDAAIGPLFFTQANLAVATGVMGIRPLRVGGGRFTVSWNGREWDRS